MAELFSDGASIASIRKFWKQFEVYVCESPPELNGSKVTDIFLTYPEKRDLLICNITEFCPKKCHCYNQPSQGRVVVDCQGQNLTTMPKHLPWGNGDRWQLLLAGNDIQRIENRPYLSRVAELDLSGNPISHIYESAAFVLPSDAKLSIIGNKLSSLPRHFQNRNPSTLVLGRVFILCSCEDLWLRSWLSYHRYEESNTSYICQNLGENEITEADFSPLNCFPDSSNLHIILGSLTGALVVIIAVITGRVFCYPEIYILYRRKIRHVKKSHGFNYDAYISFYDEDRLQRKWVMENLAEYLESRGYSLFIPVRDADLAENREDYLRRKIRRSKNFVIILSEKYFKSTKERQENEEMEEAQRAYSEFEFDVIWKVYKDDMRRNLIIINFDNLSASEICNRWVKACCRVGEIEDFTERKGLLLNSVERKIYPPRSTYANCNVEQSRVNSVTVRDLDS
ncbi:toll-like receptor 7 [Pecten maximus]|uniref:toll-like receptor 7 n=1 Tax=Pecten maximus TaxID=6579 RepID=UPI001457FFE0|nr:toll-like receptor 7 [Pecten maximus]